MLPQLLLGHFIADYPAQTDWIFRRKLEGWPGHLMHGGVVLVAQASAVFPHTLRLAPALLGLALIHTIQDYVKVRYASRWFGALVAYFLDQALHVALLWLASVWMVGVVGESSPAVQWTATLATAFVVVNWVYHITWRVALGEEESYYRDWRWPGVLERLLALCAGLLNVPWAAPLAVTPRLLVARSRGVSLRGYRFFWLDAILGLVLSAALGFVLIHSILF